MRQLDSCLHPRQRRLHEHALRRALAPALLDYQWHLRQVMAARGMFSTTDLIVPLADRDITLSSSQVYRLVTDRPERLSLKILMALLDILDCTMDDLIEPVAGSRPTRRRPARAAGRPASESCGPGEPGSPGPRSDRRPWQFRSGGPGRLLLRDAALTPRWARPRPARWAGSGEPTGGGASLPP